MKKIVQWTYPDTKNPGDAIAFNKNEENQKQFYEVEVGQYGQPIIIQEPDLALELQEKVGDGIQKIAGIITDDGQRFSISNAFLKNIPLKWNREEMSLEINGEKYWLQFLYEPDRNRVVNYVGFFSYRERIKNVEVKEMADVLEDLFRLTYC